MKSMTGFGKATSQSPDFLLDVTVKAVNGRFLEIKFHGPKIYNILESEMRKRVAKHIKRGTVDLYFNRKVFNGSEKVLFNSKLAKKWLAGFNAMAAELKLQQAQTSEVLLSVPELIKVEEANVVSSKEKTALFKSLEDALSSCAKVRSSEGASLKKDIQWHLKSLSAQVQKVKKLRDKTRKDLLEKYKKRLESYDTPGEFDEQRVAQEIVIQVDKSDISEEIQRLEAHIKAITSLVKDSGTIGKKLDFYAQELLREVNTVGSKSSSSDLTQVVVEAKGFVEKYREQVQNVE
ncbi:MAG: YicC/YloC family endoribonuclease [Pseudomonadota bacterium]